MTPEERFAQAVELLEPAVTEALNDPTQTEEEVADELLAAALILYILLSEDETGVEPSLSLRNGFAADLTAALTPPTPKPSPTTTRPARSSTPRCAGSPTGWPPPPSAASPSTPLNPARPRRG